MGAAEIIAELPKLSADERTAIARRLRELEEQDATQFLHDAAVQMFEDMDRREADDAHRTAG